MMGTAKETFGSGCMADAKTGPMQSSRWKDDNKSGCVRLSITHTEQSQARQFAKKSSFNLNTWLRHFNNNKVASIFLLAE